MIRHRHTGRRCRRDGWRRGTMATSQRAVTDVVSVGVVDVLEAVEIHHEQRYFLLQTLGAGGSRVRCMNMKRVFGSAVRGSVRVFLRLLEHDRVVDVHRGLLECGRAAGDGRRCRPTARRDTPRWSR